VTRHLRVVDSPLGPLRLCADAAGRLTGLVIGTGPQASTDPAGVDEDETGRAHRTLDDAATQLEQYFEGTRRCFDLPMSMEGSAFQRQVWAQLQQIPFGTTVTYGQLAEQLGRRGAARAVGHANARNPIPVMVPCHRVIGSSGQLTGYGGGLVAKRLLLDLEGRNSAPAEADGRARDRRKLSLRSVSRGSRSL
jgi:methylated-DNA-[protein]-cysteine S-methyltransferase